jgi:polyisoprenoid-binding protein YceI
MRTRLIGAIAILALTVPAATAQAQRVQPTIQLTVEGTSTVRSFKCTATKLTSVVELDPAGGGLALAELEKTVRGVEVRIPVAALDCGNGKMNDHMRKALKAESHPEITYVLTGHELVSQDGDRGTVRMTGKLTIAGTENPITMDVSATPAPDGSLRVEGAAEILMKQYNVEPPSLMLGTLKVHDKVVVRFDATVAPTAVVAAEAN